MQGQPIKEEHQKFRKTMLNRANKLDEILKKSESIALVYSQECANTPFPDDQKLIEFLKSFSEIYPGKKIYLILTKIENIKDVQNKIVFEENNLKIIKFTFWDYGENWTGNHSAWDKVIGSINLV
ncbi:MAG: hypothetical protein IJJ04_01600 [Clostridia bacterium]|nr:hypothetical protein [Clostridia bacterium]